MTDTTDISDSSTDKKPNAADRAEPCGHGNGWAGNTFYPCTHPDCVSRQLAPGEVPPNTNAPTIAPSSTPATHDAELCSPDDYETGPEDAEQMGAEAERARIREAVEAIQNAVPQDVENRAWVQQGIEIMRGRVLAAIDGGPTDG